MDLAGECFDIVEAIQHPYRFRKLVPDSLLSKGVVLIEPVGKMLHGLVESLEARVSARNV
jgi:hypothetical protein